MAQATLDQRIQDSTEARRKFWDMLTIEGIGGILMLIAGFIAIAGFFFVFTEPTWFNFASEFYANVSSELASIVITIFVLDKLQQRRDENQRKLALFRQLKSRSNGLAIDAIDQLRHDNYWNDMLTHFKDKHDKPYLRDVLWQGADLSWAKLSGADLSWAKLSGAELNSANLEGAKLGFANFSGAKLISAKLSGANLMCAKLLGAHLSFANFSGAQLIAANFSGAYLSEANLEGANLSSANFSGAYLSEANLEGANLSEANLEGANLSSANFSGADVYGVTCDENTILPDGTNWTPYTDWSTFGAVQMNPFD